MTETTVSRTDRSGEDGLPQVHQLMRRAAELTREARQASDRPGPYAYAGHADDTVVALELLLRQLPILVDNTVRELDGMEQRGALYVSPSGQPKYAGELLTEIRAELDGLCGALRTASDHVVRMRRSTSRFGTEV